MKYVVHDADGKILRHGTCAPEDFFAQASGAGESVVEADQDEVINDRTHMVADGEIVARPAELLALEEAAARLAPAWPSVQEQLDALFAGGADFEAMKARRGELKAQLPTAEKKG